MQQNLFHDCLTERNLGCFQNVLIKSNTSIEKNGLDHRPFCICEICLSYTFLDVFAGPKGRYICNFDSY